MSIKNNLTPVQNFHILGGIEHTANNYYKCPVMPVSELRKTQSAIESAVKEMSRSEEEDITREGDYLSGFEVPVSDCLEYEEYAERLEDTASTLHDKMCLIHKNISLALSSGEMSDEVSEILEECLSEAEEVIEGYFTFGEIKHKRLSQMHKELLTRLGMHDSNRFVYDIARRGEGYSSHYYLHHRQGCDIRWDGTCLSFESEEGVTTFKQSHYDYVPSKGYIDKGYKQSFGKYDDLFDSFEDYLSPTENEIKMYKMLNGKDYPLGYLKARCDFQP